MLYSFMLSILMDFFKERAKSEIKRLTKNTKKNADKIIGIQAVADRAIKDLKTKKEKDKAAIEEVFGHNQNLIMQKAFKKSDRAVLKTKKLSTANNRLRKSVGER